MLTMNGPVGALALAGGLVAVIVMGAGQWMTAKKAGFSGLDALAPHRSTILMIRMAGLENWKIPRIALLLGPFLPFLICLVPLGIARQFGKGRLFGLGLLLLPFVFFPILGFGGSKYSPASRPEATVPRTARGTDV
jgi:hypothetical protein